MVDPHPPPFWEPLIKKKLSFILHYRPLGTFSVFTKKLKFPNLRFIPRNERNQMNFRWSNWSGITTPLCKTCFSTSEWIWHTKKYLVNLQKFWDLGTPPPPPCWEKFPNNIVFFNESVPYQKNATKFSENSLNLVHTIVPNSDHFLMSYDHFLTLPATHPIYKFEKYACRN